MANPQEQPLLPQAASSPPYPVQHELPSPGKGYALMASSAFFNVLMTFLVHVAETSFAYPTFSAVIIRIVTSLLLPALYLCVNNLSHVLKLPRIQWVRLAVRGLAGATATVCSFHALSVLPVGTAVTLFYASPAITSVLAALLLGDPFTFSHAVTLIVNFTGIALVSHATGSVDTNTSSALSSVTGGDVARGVAFALGAATASSVAYTLQRMMGMGVHFVLGVMSSGVGCLLLSAAFASAGALRAITSNGVGTLLAIASGLASFCSMSLLNRGFQHAPAGPAAVVRSTNVPISFVLGIVFLGEKPTGIGLVGVLLVVASVLSIAWRQWRRSRGG